MLKAAKEQVTGSEAPKEEGGSEKQKIVNQQDQLQDKMKSSRLMEAYQRELTDIQKEELFKDLQRRIAQGEEIPLENYPGLSIEQKQVLKAQMEAVAARKVGSGMQNAQLQEPTTRKSRRLFNFGKKQEVKRQQTRVENIVPPSG